MDIDDEVQDLEEKFQLSATIDFSFTEENFDGLKEFEINIKKKENKPISIENVDLRKHKGSLF